MRKGFLAAVIALLVGGGVASAQEPVVMPAIGPAAPTETIAWDETSLPSNRYWLSGEYLLWWFNHGPQTPPLATTAPLEYVNGIPGALGSYGTTVVLGGDRANTEEHHGARFTAGFWFDGQQTLGLEGNYFFLCPSSVTKSVARNGGFEESVLTNPITEVGFPGGPFPVANYLAFPGSRGSASATVTNRLQGAELNGLYQAVRNERCRFSLLGGFRYMNFYEDLELITTQRTFVDFNGFPPNQFLDTLDNITTRNNFYGGQLGAKTECSIGRLVLSGVAKVALGDMHETARVSGASTLNTTNSFSTLIPVTTAPGGIIALPTNMGHFSRDQFAVVPSVNFNVGYQAANWLRLFVGYDFLYVSNVARPGNQIDMTINSTQFPSLTGNAVSPLVGTPRPRFEFHDSDFWAQGISFGMQVQW